ncbi:DUF6057 family protein [uncultured Parabacteroides sp.]|uniref:DUF6057 family protein n=2 Tax=uncultured Parabacteroides sp. TaxID=512312 RepID=UPI0025CE856E|nr:DUF6057 family protein [uncultured Parabacteroides sp.]
MAKREILLQSIAAILFGAMCFAFFRFVYPSDFFQKEQAEGLFTLGSFASYLDKPAWLVRYGGKVLMSFCGPSGAPFLITLVLLLEWRLLTLILKRFNVGGMASLYAFFPVVLEWGGYCHPTYLLHSILSTIVSLSLFWGYTYIRNKWLSVLAGLLALPAIYFIAGNRLNFFVLLILFYEIGKDYRRWVYWGLLLVTGIMMPIWMGHFYSLSQEQAYLYPHNGLPSFFPPILFCFSLLLLQMKKFRNMAVRALPVMATACTLLVLLGTFILLLADF